MKYILLTGRILFSSLFIFSFFINVLGDPNAHAFQLTIPATLSLVPLAGAVIFVGGVSILLGFKAKTGAWLIVLCLLPVSFYLHAFWKIDDPLRRQIQMVHLIKDISLIGGALMIAWFGAGPLSIDSAIASRKKAK